MKDPPSRAPHPLAETRAALPVATTTAVAWRVRVLACRCRLFRSLLRMQVYYPSSLFIIVVDNIVILRTRLRLRHF